MGNSPSSSAKSPYGKTRFDHDVPISKPHNPHPDGGLKVPTVTHPASQSQTSLNRSASDSARPAPRSNNPFRRQAAANHDSSGANFLAVPGAGTHRRSRSTSSVRQPADEHPLTRESLLAPPPPYSPVAPIPPFRGGGSPRPLSVGVPSPSPQRPRPVTPQIYTSDRAGPAGLGSHYTQVFGAADPAGPYRSNPRLTRMPRRNVDFEYLRAPMRKESAENALETLRKYNTVIIVDDSRSMAGKLWTEARSALGALAEIASEYDTDGIDVHFLNDRKIGTDLRSSVAVKRLFDTVIPRGATPIGEKLEELFMDYMANLERAKRQADNGGDRAALKNIKPVNYIVLTDGTPTDEPESVIVAMARRLDAGFFPITQVGVQFVQIGNDPRATAYLRELDDVLSNSYGIRDIVDMTPYTGGPLNAEMLTKILLGGINRRVDRRGGASVMGYYA
ncbi:hypothetical protein PLICRDRAFT_47663 [Plicaturopsis crispa FD-325 SS-3]|nr:hypothetical protein PLICRDRAFT_47663 [Plicaturopsis crispa FD-325 SS-3]